MSLKNLFKIFVTSASQNPDLTIDEKTIRSQDIIGSSNGLNDIITDPIDYLVKFTGKNKDTLYRYLRAGDGKIGKKKGQLDPAAALIIMGACDQLCIDNGIPIEKNTVRNYLTPLYRDHLIYINQPKARNKKRDK